MAKKDKTITATDNGIPNMKRNIVTNIIGNTSRNNEEIKLYLCKVNMAEEYFPPKRAL